MYCAYHTTTTARIQCANCNRGLCSSCDHRIKGFPYCQDCIVRGIQSLQRQSTQYNYYQSQQPKRGSSGKAILAALCAFIPGAGAIYNRQNLKAVIHFITTIALFQLGNIHAFGVFFGLGGALFYFYTILDAYRTARAISAGESAADNEEKFKRSLIKRAPSIGVGLIIAGLLVFVHLLHPLSQYLSFTRTAPVALIILGGYLLTRYFKKSREYPADYAERQSFHLVSGNYSDRDPHKVNESSRFGNYR
jgi:TM2 domain-containing membrane protein YozV